MLDLISIGIALVDSIIRGFDPTPVSVAGYRAVSGSLNVGGDAVNEVMAASGLGLKSGILCHLGQDEAGDMVIHALERRGIATDRIIRSGETPVTTIFLKEDGTRQSITNEAHRYNFHPEKTPNLFTDSRALVLGSLFRAPFDDPAIIRSVLTSAKQAGQTVFADTKIPNFRFLSLSDVRESLPLIDYITPNEDEARHYTGKDDPEEMADVFLAHGVRNVIIKLGARGCFLKGADGIFRLPAYPIHAVDATGAGDNFLAGFVSSVLRGDAVYDALVFASACGAICSTAVGASGALRSRDQVLEWMKSHSFPSSSDRPKRP